jgi:4-hydroxybenzoate polyprenyltransferase
LYSLFLKKEAFVDVLVIGINFVIRASSGAFIIDVTISHWLIIGIFFLSLFLSIGKRQADLIFLGKNAKKHRAVLEVYSRENTTALMIVATSLLVITYTFYSFSNDSPHLIFTLPFSLYVIFRYFTLVFTGSEIPRHPERTVKDYRMMAGILLWFISFIVLFYMI